MNSETIVHCVVALLLGILLANMHKSVCGCKTVEGNSDNGIDTSDAIEATQNDLCDMYKGGADIAIIEELLGHKNLSTTEIYTHVANEDLAQTLNESHPRAVN